MAKKLLLLCLICQSLSWAAPPRPCDPSKKDFYNQHCMPASQDQRTCNPNQKGFFNQNCVKRKEVTPPPRPNSMLQELAPTSPKGTPSHPADALIRGRIQSPPVVIPPPREQQDNEETWSWIQ